MKYLSLNHLRNVRGPGAEASPLALVAVAALPRTVTTPPGSACGGARLSVPGRCAPKLSLLSVIYAIWFY